MSADKKKRKKWYQSGNSSNKRQCADLFQDGMKGLLVTCNLREVECLRETYSLLNEYNDKLQADAQKDGENSDEDCKEQELNADLVSDDIEAEMQKEIAALKNPAAKKFRQIPTKCKNVIFVQILNSLDPLSVMQQVFNDIKQEGKGKARFANRVIPVQGTSKATIDGVQKVLTNLLGEVSQEASSFMVLCKIRNNNDVKRMDFVEAAAGIVKKLRPAWKVDFDQPSITVTIDIMIKVCCISLLPDYMQLKKYNVIEYASSFKTVSPSKNVDEKIEQE